MRDTFCEITWPGRTGSHLLRVYGIGWLVSVAVFGEVRSRRELAVVADNFLS